MTKSAANNTQATTADRNRSNDVPHHIAFIMDGNGRWAKKRGKMVSAGHRAGIETVRDILELCADRGVKIVTLFAFSSENWLRPKSEVKALMTLFASYLKSEVKKLHADGVRIRFIGDRARFAASLLKQMEKAEQLTANNSDTTLVIAVDYSGRWDIANAARQIAQKVQCGQLSADQVDTELMAQHISLTDIPAPDLCIRTSGEQRISNFMLWQMAYTEFYFTKILWPDFSKLDLEQAFQSYRERDRRFGGRLDGIESQPEDYSALQVDQSA